MMQHRSRMPTRIKQCIAGQPIPVGERTIQPVAQVAGWIGSASGEAGGGAGAWLRVTPIEVAVREADGTERRISITDRTQETIRRFLLAALLVTIVCWLIMIIIKETHT